MPTSVECPGCGKRYKVSDNLAGQRVWCGCGRTLTAPTSRPRQASGASAEDRQEQSLSGVIAPNPVGDSPTSQQQVAADDLLDEKIWDAESRVETPAETTEAEARVSPSPVARLAPGVPAVANNLPRPTATDDTEYEPETSWGRVKSLSRELVVWLSIGYGIWMLFFALSMIVLHRLTFSFLLILILSPLTIAGGALIKIRHPLGPSFAGLASAGIAFFVLMATLMSGFSLGVVVVFIAVEVVFFYSAPACIIYWCLKEEEAMDEEAKRDDLFVIRESLKDRMIEENRKEWESK